MGKRRKPAAARQCGLGTALLLTAASALLPGLAHLRAGRRETGRALLAGYALLAGSALVLAVRTGREGALRLAVQPAALVGVMAAMVLLATGYCAVLISSYRAVRPVHASGLSRLAGHGVVGTLCLAAVGSLTYTAHSAYVQHELIDSVFSDRKPAFLAEGKDPWANKPRLNVLLLGGDGDETRVGIRTDSVILASIDTRTGNTVLLSLPRNLQRAPMPPGPARRRFPDGFTGEGGGSGAGLLNAVWLYGQNHPALVPGSDAPGPDLLKATVGTVLGQPVDYYLLVNLDAFRDIVDAFGGVTLRVSEPIVYGQENKVLRPGLRRLTGSQALWYSRSRTNTDDYDRMRRQRCMVGAIARQANPRVVLTRFQQIATATRKAVLTDLPASLLPDLLTLAAKARTAKIESIAFTPPLIKPARADFDKIRRITAAAVSGSAQRPPDEKGTDAGTGDAEAARPSGSKAPAPVEETCRYD